MEEIRTILLDAGYHRVRILGLDPFDMLIGGLAWCVTMCNVDVEGDIDLVFHEGLDHLTIGQKMKTSERITWALQEMKCPFPLAPHQIKGLDYPYIRPVVQWLVRNVAEVQKELGNINRRYTHLEFEQHFPSFIDEREERDRVLAERREAAARRKQTRISKAALGELVTSHAAEIRQARDEYQERADEQAETAQLLMHKRNKELKGTLVEEIGGLESVVDELADTVQAEKAALKEAKDALKGQRKEAKLATKKVDRSLEGMQAGGNTRAAEVFEALCDVDRIKERMAAYPQETAEEEARLTEAIARATEELDSMASEGGNAAKVHAAISKERKKITALQAAIDETEQAMDVVQATRGDEPSAAELGVYQRRLSALFEDIGIRMEETKVFYSLCNMLSDVKAGKEKEAKLLESIAARFKAALKSGKQRDGFTAELKTIAGTVTASVNKAEQRLAEKQSLLTEAEALLNAALDTSRTYARLVAQLRREGERNAELVAMLEG